MAIGSIYLYRNPDTQKPMYVGSTQDGNTMRRHREHVKEKRSIGPWLRSFCEPPIPTEICKHEYFNIEDLFNLENKFMHIFKTRKKHGGLNVAVAGQLPAQDKDQIIKAAHMGFTRIKELYPDLSVLGNIGASAYAQLIKLHPEIEVARRWKIGNAHRGIRRGPHTDAHRKSIGNALRGKPKSIEHAKRVAEARRNRDGWKPSEETKQKIRNTLSGRKGSPLGGMIATHNRWHARRGFMNLQCQYCVRDS